jgi:hypothetical protein
MHHQKRGKPIQCLLRKENAMPLEISKQDQNCLYCRYKEKHFHLLLQKKCLLGPHGFLTKERGAQFWKAELEKENDWSGSEEEVVARLHIAYDTELDKKYGGDRGIRAYLHQTLEDAIVEQEKEKWKNTHTK